MVIKNFLKIANIVLFCILFHVPAFAGNDLTIVYSMNFQPFSWEDSQGDVKGILVDFMDEILEKKMQVPIRHEVCPWSRCQHMVRNGKRDAMLTVATPERRTYTEISKIPFFSSDFILFTGFSNPFREHLRNIKNIEMLLQHKKLIHVYIHKSGWHTTHLKNLANVITVNDSIKIMELLKHNRADVYVEQAALVRYQIRKLRMEKDILEIPNVMQKTNWHLCIRKSSPYAKLMPEIDRVMKSMEKTGELDSLRTKIFNRYK